MELVEGIKLRKSIRGYKPTPVSKEILAEILEIATRAPSGLNVQPWKLTVLGGEVLESLKKALQEQYLAGVERHPDFEPAPVLPAVYRDRQVGLAKTIFQIMDIARQDKERRKQ